MRLAGACAQAAAAILANRLRSGLGALAIAAAVSTLLIVNVALDGIQQYAAVTTARTFGADTFLIAQVASPGSISRSALRDQLERNPPITRGEAAFLYRHADGIVRYAPNAQARADVVRGHRRSERVPITGTTSTLAAIRDLNLVNGTFFTEDDDRAGSPVAVIGADIAETLFPDGDPIGGAIRLAGRRFDVIGVQGRIGTGSFDQYVWIPIRAFERALGAPRSLQLFAAAPRQEGATLAEDRARTSMRAVRSLDPAVADTFDVLAPEAARGFVANLSSRIGAAAVPISLMAMLAAVIVVANTVLVSVTQRTREIGLRRALGARRGDIIREVLAESVLLALIGGACGAMMVALALAAASPALPIPLGIDRPSVVIALAAAAASGILAGWLPAVRATRLDVIAAIRSE